ncbi:large-conductance mechanosensitive channel protein MscL [Clostridium sp. DJ247]|uniref:large-conductance mechanosensitive channel protein MscL n=1 Tax=Clostridium sp. DJ247 TaxID=2726188 RepID=UPI00162987AA|nr:large-conductance mechanosensitive channel protein MscL [Clostridium sp. DJ247]MBC2578799.1 large-conductance mechanosensitive channel protein MscL [Clostridium sp. DJ247]
MFEEFKKFAVKGNVIDLAVGVIIGGAFGKIVSSLVNDIIMPVLGILIGGINFTNLKLVIRPAQNGAAELAVKYGQFMQSIADFLIISFSIFLLVKGITSLKKKEEAQDKNSQPSKEELLLTEIRDLLKKRTK